jgi:hypothetical protein
MKETLIGLDDLLPLCLMTSTEIIIILTKDEQNENRKD